jgi:hypothetical protein
MVKPFVIIEHQDQALFAGQTPADVLGEQLAGDAGDEGSSSVGGRERPSRGSVPWPWPPSSGSMAN